MTSSIQPLPVQVVHHIAAGEVIDSMAAAVQELVENALDAQATRLHLALWPQQWRIRLADNGRGMALADLQRAATPHSTSKIRTEADLWHIGSLGFRGQALHSLAVAGQLEICSRPAASPDGGWRIRYGPQGEPQDQGAVAIATGTIVTVSDLFGPWPSRRQGLPSRSQQLRAVQHTIHQIALCHPHLTWQVELEGRPWFSLAPTTSARELLPQILKSVHSDDLRETTLEVTDADGQLLGQLQLLVGLPDRCHRHRPDWVRMAVNGRAVTVPELEQSSVTAFRSTLPRQRYPLCWVHLQVPPHHVDWNRHPHKSALYLRQLECWRQHLTEGIEKLLRLSDAAATLQRIQPLLAAAEGAGSYNLCDSLPGTTPTLRVLCQVHGRYILAEHPGGICLIEQHIAHERVLYEQLRHQWQPVPLPTPLMLEHLTAAQVQQLEELDLDVELFGPQLWAVRRVPTLLKDRADLQEAILELSLAPTPEAALVATACRSAIRNGAPLTLAAMEQLVADWQRTRQPRTCPHGRPICLTLEETQLARFFRRHWVVGKSHGLEASTS